MPTVKPFRMSKSYVLVDESTYERKFADNDTTQPNERLDKGKATNPFQNPRVRDVKEDRERIRRVINDNDLTAEEANDITRTLIDRYRLNFAKATGGKKRSVTSGSTRISRHHTSASPPIVRRSRAVSRSPSPRRSRPISRSIAPKRSRHSPPVSRSPSPRRTSVVSRSISPEGNKHFSAKERHSRQSIRRKDDHPYTPQRSSSTTKFRTRSDVQEALGGYIPSSMVSKVTPLLNELAAAGYVDGKTLRPIKEKSLITSRNGLINYIRDVTLNDPDRRMNDADRIQQFDNFLKSKGIDFPIERSRVRTSIRQHET